jgi:hypothetical protein
VGRAPLERSWPRLPRPDRRSNPGRSFSSLSPATEGLHIRGSDGEGRRRGQRVPCPTIPHWGTLMLAPWVAWRNKTPRGTRGVRGAAVGVIRSQSRNSATGSSTSTAQWCAPSAQPRAKRAGSPSAASLAELPEVASHSGVPEPRAPGRETLLSWCACFWSSARACEADSPRVPTL